MISVILTVYDQALTLGWVLAALAHQDTREPFEVLVCDDGSDPTVLGTLAAAQRESGLDVRYLWQPHAEFRASRSRNNGIRCAQGDLLLFLDADIVVPPDFVRRHAELHAQSPRCVVAGSRDWVFLEEPAPAHHDARLAYFASHAQDCDRDAQIDASTSTTPWGACLGCNISVPRGAGVYFDEAFVGWGFEDREFAYRLTGRLGHRLVFVPDLSGYHIVQGTADQWLDARASTSHEALVLYLRGLLYFLALYPEVPAEPVLGYLRHIALDPATDRWRASRMPAPDWRPLAALDRVRHWFDVHHIDYGASAPPGASAGASPGDHPAPGDLDARLVTRE